MSRETVQAAVDGFRGGVETGLKMAQAALAGEDSIEWAREAKASSINLAYAITLLDDLIESHRQ